MTRPRNSHPERKLLRVDGEPNPFETFMLAIAVLQGWLVLSGLAQPSTIQAALGNNLRIVWASMLLFGGATALAGLHWPADLHTGFEIKRVGLFASGMSTLVYGLALAFVGPAGYVAAIIQIGFAAACFYRIYQITRRIRRVRAQLVAARNTED